MQRYRVPLGVLVFLLIVRVIAGMNTLDSTAIDAAEEPPYVRDELLCRFRPEATELEKSGARAELLATRSHQFLSGAELWKLPSGRSVQSAIELMSTKESVVYAEPNYYGEFTQSLCADTYCPAQWHLTRIAATGSAAAWDYSTGSRNVVVAIPDSGGDFAHTDFGDNIWYNPSEVDGNGFDDDGNGYIDDVRGYDFGSVDNDPTSASYHGLGVAGVVGAIMGATSGSTTGVVGVSPQVSLMTLKTTVSSESPTVAKTAQAIDYAAFQGRAHIINASFVFACPNPATCHQTLKDAIKNAGDREILVVAAAGNNNRNLDLPGQGLAPVSFTLPNIIGVAGADRELGTCGEPDPNTGALTQFPCEVKTPGDTGSNWGGVSVDVVAPGKDICTDTTTLAGSWQPCCGGNYSLDCFGGTSSAAPMVVGVAALAKARHPDIPVQLLKAQLMDINNLDLLPGFVGHPTVTNGRVNAFKLISDDDMTAPTAITDLRTANRTLTSIDLFWTSSGDDGPTGTAALYQVRYSTSPITASNWVLAKHAAGVEPVPSSSGTSEVFQVAGLNCNTNYYFGIRAFDEWGNGPLSNVVQSSTLAPICPISYCGSEGSRCYWTGACGSGGCCVYQCQVDPTCFGPDECPTEEACSCAQ